MELRTRKQRQSSVHKKRKKRKEDQLAPTTVAFPLLNCIDRCTDLLPSWSSSFVDDNLPPRRELQVDLEEETTKPPISGLRLQPSKTKAKMTHKNCTTATTTTISCLWLTIIFILIKQLSCDIAKSEAAAGLLFQHNSKSDLETVTKIPPAEFKDRPQERVVIREGQEVLFRCSLHKPMHSHMWLKDNMPLFDPDMHLVDPILSKRFSFLGDLKTNDFTIELKDARVEDTGIYRCQGYPEHLPGDDMTDFEASSNLTVLPAPIITLPPPTLATPETTASDEELQNDSTFKSAKSLPSSVYVSAHQPYPSSPNNLIQAPQRPSMTRLPPPNRLLSGQANNGPNTSMNLGSVAGIAIPAFWPYLLLALAALLMFVNIYLIYSLVMRHTRSRRSAGDETSNGTQESFENNTDSSVVVQFIK